MIRTKSIICQGDLIWVYPLFSSSPVRLWSAVCSDICRSGGMPWFCQRLWRKIMIKANDAITNDFTLVLWTGQPRFKVILCVSFSSFPTLLSSKSRSGRSLITVLLLPLLTLLTCAFLHPDPSSLILILVQGHLWHLCPTVSTHPVLLKDIFNSAAPGLFWCYPEQN